MKISFLFQPKFFLLFLIAICLLPINIWTLLTGPLPLPEQEQTWSRPETVVLVFAGDVMVHEAQITAAYDHREQTYNFHPCFELISPFIKHADLAVANLETTLAGKERYYAGYPAFNSPEQLASALRDTGFDLICTANNHSLDRGEYGVLRTLDHLHEENLQTFGTYRSPGEREQFLVVEVKGIRLGFLAYTYGTNGIPVPEGKDYLVNLLDPELIVEDLQKIKKTADLVVLYLHWGSEYRRMSSESQEKLAGILFDSGADIIIGSHPHVVQPVEFFNQNRTGAGEKFTAYSLGNFISDQRAPYTDSGIILYVSLSKESERTPVRIMEVSYIPVWVQRYDPVTGTSFRVVPSPDRLDEWAAANSLLIDYRAHGRLREVQETYKEHLPYLRLGTPGTGEIIGSRNLFARVNQATNRTGEQKP